MQWQLPNIYSLSILAIVAFIVGGIPIGYVIARVCGVNDIRNHGSGNSGATNVARVLGIPFFFLVFCLDAGKAALFLWMVQSCNASPITLFIVAGALLVGNCYSIFLGFKGGKGVATSVGILSMLQPPIVLMALGVWIISFLMIRVVGIASVIAAMSVPFWGMVFNADNPMMLGILISMSTLVIIRHRDNLIRYKRQSSY